ncbi:DapH/DapD/GlmU-related protein [Limimaricola pyoseonensis]|uniref:DapH/DapD/GlmU-related protein n=1 Tax=Limimaricola pyoseonensis TaxID=521013 RepID=UPI000B802009|nr:DapH/DapD/GlmU-related protein [Limimaricola pyoseonensis]
MIRGYGPFSLLWLSICWVITKILFPGARIVRFPLFIKGRRNIKFGRGFVSGPFCRIDYVGPRISGAALCIGRNVQINDSVHIACAVHVSIGDDTLIASRVFISDHNHGSFPSEPEFTVPVAKRAISADPVYIGNNVWIGEGVAILPGVSIGDNCIIGANSVVTRNIPKNCIAVGVPAKPIKRFSCSSIRWESLS